MTDVILKGYDDKEERFVVIKTVSPKSNPSNVIVEVSPSEIIRSTYKKQESAFTKRRNWGKVEKDITWRTLKSIAKKLGGRINNDYHECESILFGFLEFLQNGEVMYYGEIICPILKYKQMKVVIENMFGELNG